MSRTPRIISDPDLALERLERQLSVTRRLVHGLRATNAEIEALSARRDTIEKALTRVNAGELPDEAALNELLKGSVKKVAAPTVTAGASRPPRQRDYSAERAKRRAAAADPNVVSDATRVLQVLKDSGAVMGLRELTESRGAPTTIGHISATRHICLRLEQQGLVVRVREPNYEAWKFNDGT